MNMWQQFLDVQALDTSLVQIDHRLAHLPEVAEREAVEARIAVLRTSVLAAEAERHTLAKEQQRLEDEISLLTDKIGRVEQQLYAGGSDVKHLQTLQDEIASLRRRVSQLEDSELELMEQTEPIDARLAELAVEQAPLDAEAIRLTAAIAEAEAELDAERARVQAQRAEAVASIDPAALAEYDAVRARLGGVAVATLQAGVCGACHLKLSAVEYDRILHLPEDEPVRCEDCGRFLVRV